MPKPLLADALNLDSSADIIRQGNGSLIQVKIRLKKDAQARILDDLLAIVGEDEVQYMPINKDTYTATQRVVGANQLRQELQTAITEYCEGDNE